MALDAAFVEDVKQTAHPLNWMGRAVISCRASEKTLKSLKTCLLTANKWLAYLTHLVKGAFQQRGWRGMCEVVLRMAAGSCWWQERLIEGKINSWLCEGRKNREGKVSQLKSMCRKTPELCNRGWTCGMTGVWILHDVVMSVNHDCQGTTDMLFESNAFWQFCYISSFALVLSICQLSHSTTGQEHLSGAFFI